MNKLLPLVILLQFVAGQEILQDFHLDKRNHYLGTTTYEFELDRSKAAAKDSWTINIHDVKGDISFSGEPGSIIQITEEVSIWSSSGLKAKSLFDDYRVKVKQVEEAGIIELSGLGEWEARSSFEYSIIIPTNCNIIAKTVGGDIDAEKIFGEVSLVTLGGDIELYHLTGKINARTSGGDIDVNYTEGIVAVNTSGGDIEVEQVAGEVSANTAGGDIDIESIQGNVNVSTSGGELTFEDIVGATLSGITSGGSIEGSRIQADIDLHTSGGDIELDDLTGTIEAETSGGDIEIEQVYGSAKLITSGGDIIVNGLRGSIRAKTNAGDLEVEKIWNKKIENHDIDLTNDYGSIYVVLPDNFPATIDATVENEISSTVIESDFPIELEKKYDEVRGESTIGDGTYSVKLRTGHGTITIERGSE